MEQQRVVSREYKVMLRPELFTGAESALLAEAHALWEDVVEKIGEVVVHVDGDPSRIKARRLISFFDTRDHRLVEAHYIFRERRATDGSQREVTLKFRHPDRFLAQARDMKAAHENSGRLPVMPRAEATAGRSPVLTGAVNRCRET